MSDSEKDNIHDVIGFWSEIKLQIIRDYLPAYSAILRNQKNPPFKHAYIDAFAGSGKHVSKSSGSVVAGSPAIALDTEPPFHNYYFIDLDQQKIASLAQIASNRSDVEILHGDCNDILLRQVLPSCRYEDYRRAVCVLDPYSLQLDWKVVATAGAMGTVEVFINFPVMDINRNVLRAPGKVVYQSNIERMNRFWGDESWRSVGYQKTATLWGTEEEEKAGASDVVQAYRDRLKKVAGFKYVPEPIPMWNTQKAVVYYLFFASPKPVAADIIEYIFNKYRTRGLGYG